MQYMIIARVIVSLVRMSRENFIVNFIFVITEPILKPIRELINKSALGRSDNPIDFSPLIVFVLINFIILPLLRNWVGGMMV